MPIGRIFGDLSVFDLLGNFVPGILLMGSIIALLPPDRVTQIGSSPLAAVFLLGVVAFALGHLIQSYAARAVGKRETFRNSILVNQSLGKSAALDFDEFPTAHPCLYSVYSWLHPEETEEWNLDNYLNGDPVEGDTDVSVGEGVLDSETIVERFVRVPARWYRAVIEAAAMVRIKRDRPLSDVTLAGKTWAICRKKYDLDRKYDQYGDLLHLISSDIESVAASSRALRFQAIRNFHRGMWIACYFSLLLMVTVVVARGFSEQVTVFAEFVGLTVWKPVIVEFWTPIWMLCLGYAVLLYFFWELKEDFEEEFIEYLLTDFLAIHEKVDEEDEDEPAWKRRDSPNWYQ
ncbi:hypothetical protein [Halorussus sp. MSC15.2]|uniref:hypothetical protein n=1 Tax=Halorussus sp. MSC15.2 TaxID=2283638 RepID=UPI0013D69879|nr:hypothetical protein [Halorussus sp. MSC15.2]NEU58778.1 hypothetical protein [Halorussus sp. MSC15.2]